jgi:hypothetical protein
MKRKNKKRGKRSIRKRPGRMSQFAEGQGKIGKRSFKMKEVFWTN